MIKISVISPSIRPKGLEVVKESLSNQTFQDFEWLVEFGFGKKMSYSKDVNKLLARAKGELIVSYQDYIKIQPTACRGFGMLTRRAKKHSIPLRLERL